MPKAQINLRATDIYYRNKQATTRIIINRGGAGSSKTKSILQLLIVKLLTEKKKKILILGKTLPSLRASAYEEFLTTLSEMGVSSLVREEKQFLIYRYKDSSLRFLSVDDPEKLKSSNYSYIFMEEATSFTLEDFMQIKLRLREPSIDGNRNQIYMAFNPIDEFHWIKEKLIDVKVDPDKEEKITEIVSTYRDNPFLQQDYIDDVEDLINQDVNYFRIYAEGEWGRLENLVYRNWQIVQTSPRDSTESFYGLDFGFNAPTSLVKCVPINLKTREIYLQELLYKPGLTNSDLIARMQHLIPKSMRGRPIYCDSAEPDRIKEIKLAGFRAKEANKRVNDGIDFVKRYKLKIPYGAANLKKELQAYSWKTNKNGDVQDDPVDFLNHAMDATRYALYTHLSRGNKSRVRWLGGR